MTPLLVVAVGVCYLAALVAVWSLLWGYGEA